jgi:hypothetical protein
MPASVTAERPWFQFHLSSLICMQMMLAALIYLNLGDYNLRHEYFGWPCAFFRWYGWSRSIDICDDAFHANLCIWPSLVLFALVVPEVFTRLKQKNCLSPMKIWQLLDISRITILVLFVTFGIYIGICAIPNQNAFDPQAYKCGWPSPLYYHHAENSSAWAGYRYFVVDLYAFGAIATLICTVCELIIRRRSRGSIATKKPR